MYAAELVGFRIEAPDIMRPVFRTPDDVILVYMNPMRAGQRIWIDIWNMEFRGFAGFWIKPADIRTAVSAVPDITFGIAADVMSGEFKSRQLVFRDDRTRSAPLRPRQCDKRRVFRIGTAHRGEPFHQLRFQRVVEPPLRPHQNQWRTRAMRHPAHDLGPAMLVVTVAQNLLIGMAEIAVRRQQLLFFTRA